MDNEFIDFRCIICGLFQNNNDKGSYKDSLIEIRNEIKDLQYCREEKEDDILLLPRKGEKNVIFTFQVNFGDGIIIKKTILICLRNCASSNSGKRFRDLIKNIKKLLKNKEINGNKISIEDITDNLHMKDEKTKEDKGESIMNQEGDISEDKRKSIMNQEGNTLEDKSESTINQVNQDENTSDDNREFTMNQEGKHTISVPLETNNIYLFGFVLNNGISFVSQPITKRTKKQLIRREDCYIQQLRKNNLINMLKYWLSSIFVEGSTKFRDISLFPVDLYEIDKTKIINLEEKEYNINLFEDIISILKEMESQKKNKQKKRKRKAKRKADNQELRDENGSYSDTSISTFDNNSCSSICSSSDSCSPSKKIKLITTTNTSEMCDENESNKDTNISPFDNNNYQNNNDLIDNMNTRYDSNGQFKGHIIHDYYDIIKKGNG